MTQFRLIKRTRQLTEYSCGASALRVGTYTTEGRMAPACGYRSIRSYTLRGMSVFTLNPSSRAMLAEMEKSCVQRPSVSAVASSFERSWGKCFDRISVTNALTWARAPQGTAELALVVEDPDAPDGTFTHWLASGLPPASVALPQRVPPSQSQIPGPTPLTQGRNDFGDVGYIKAAMQDVKMRVSAIEQNIGLLNGRVDRMEARLSRIERRLELTEV